MTTPNLLAGIPRQAEALAALLLFAIYTAIGAWYFLAALHMTAWLT